MVAYDICTSKQGSITLLEFSFLPGSVVEALGGWYSGMLEYDLYT